MSQETASILQRCPAVRKDGAQCTARPGPSGYCIGHDAGAQAARRKGGRGKSRAERAGKLLPARLRPVADVLEAALGEVYRGELDPRQAQAMSSLAGAIVRDITAGELEDRLRTLEAKAKWL